MPSVQKRNRGENCPRGVLLTLKNLSVTNTGLVSSDFWRYRFIDGLKRKGADNILCSSEFRELRQSDVPGESKRAQRPDAVPVWIDFIPGNTMPGGLGNCVVIVMPAFAKSQNSHPKTIGRVIASQEALRTPHMGRRIYEPRGVKAEHGPHENSPHQVWQSTNDEEKNAKHRQRNPVPLADPDMKFIFAKIGDVRQERVQLVMHGLTSQNPAHMSPQPAIVWRMGITFFVGILVMHAMRGDPENRSTFQRERATGGQEILNPFWRFIAPMRQQAMVAHSDAKAPRNPPQKYG